MATEPHDHSPDDPPKTPVAPTSPSFPITPSRSTSGGPGPSQVSSKPDTEASRQHATKGQDADADEDDEDEDSAEENDSADEEPRLKYHRLTGNLSSVYRNGDATSSFLVGGDKMVPFLTP
jgi:hypothetical protein